jgi:hypothetical protein
MNQIIIDAIQNKSVLQFNYQGHNRIVEPHAYGISTAGNEVLRCYQTHGTSQSGPVPCWRLIKESEIIGLSSTGESFVETRVGYSRNDKNMSRIYAQL